MEHNIGLDVWFWGHVTDLLGATPRASHAMGDPKGYRTDVNSITCPRN
jgi:hypothetical protein